MKRMIRTSIDASKYAEDAHGRNSQGQTWQEWLDTQYYEGFNPGDLSDEEFYELEDAFYES